MNNRLLFVLAIPVALCGSAACSQSANAQEAVRIVVDPQRTRQEFGGLGVGAIFFEGHITSLAARGKDDRQESLYDDMFAKVPTDYLQLMIRETHEPENDNDDPYQPDFKAEHFKYCQSEIAIAKAARKRNPDMKLFATLYTPPPWMKTNNAASGGGKQRATLKPGLELELAEYVWAYLNFMNQAGVSIDYLSISNEPDWPHTQPGYCLTAEQNAELFLMVARYLDRMRKTHPDLPQPKLVSPNTLSAPDAVKNYVPKLLAKAGKHLDVISSHDYDRRGERWASLQRLGGDRPVWMSEWCARDKDASTGMIDSAIQYGASMHEVFTGGANVYMAYDWVYPPRDSGEALIHVDWGKDYTLTKPYHLFRQWALPLEAGMKVTTSSVNDRRDSKVKPTAFVDAEQQTLVVHVVNEQEQQVPLELILRGKFTQVAACQRTRTSASESVAELPELQRGRRAFQDQLPARSMTTYHI